MEYVAHNEHILEESESHSLLRYKHLKKPEPKDLAKLSALSTDIALEMGSNGKTASFHNAEFKISFHKLHYEISEIAKVKSSQKPSSQKRKLIKNASGFA